MPKKAKKHEILGGIKVSSEQLSEWGKIGGRPKQYLTNAERQRAYKLRKKQEKFGKEVELRDYRSYQTITGYDENKNGNWFKCDACHFRVYGGELTGQGCQNCYGNYAKKYQGKGIYEKELKIVNRAGSVLERWKRWREKKENMNKKQECQHDWETISDFQSYGYNRCKKCGITG